MRLINAEELLKILQEQQKIGNVNDSRGRAKAILEVIHAPTVEAEPVKHGRWKTYDVVKILAFGRTLDGFCQCEACGSIFPINFSEYSFCPECGARMDGDTE